MRMRIHLFAAAVAVIHVFGCQGKEDLVSAGNKSLSLGAFEEALADFDSALEKDPGYIEAMLGKAEAYLGAGKIDQAESWHSKATQAAPENQQAQKALVDFYMALGQKEHSASRYNAAAEWYAKIAGVEAAEPAKKAAAKQLAECRFQVLYENIRPKLGKLKQAENLGVAVRGVAKAPRRGSGATKKDKARNAAISAAHDKLRKIALKLSSKAGDPSAAAGVRVESSTVSEEGWLRRGRTYRVKVALSFKDLARLIFAIEQGSAPAIQ